MNLNSDAALSWSEAPPDPVPFILLRAACGWGTLSNETAKNALKAGTHNITVREKEELIAFGRVVGDGALYFYLQDIVVAPSWQGRGLGHEIVRRLLTQVRQDASAGSTVGLMSVAGKEAFYARHGFRHRPDGPLGAGMTLVV